MEIVSVAITSMVSAVALFIIAKFVGHKQMSQLDFFDYITGITIGSIAAELATELEKPLNPLIAMLVYGIIAFALSFITAKFPKMRKFINGTPTILLYNGKLYRKNFKKAKLELSEFLTMCRRQGYFNLNDIQTAVFEYNGQLSVLPKATKRPLNGTDINIVPKPDNISVELIMDGRIMGENLERMNVDANWLKTTLKSNGYNSIDRIFLCLCDTSHNLTVFEVI